MADWAEAGSLWQSLSAELDRWKEADLAARLWLRDDDAVEPTPNLEQLSNLTLRFAVPLVLAVIPAKTDERLARWLLPTAHIHPVVHGWAHANHAPTHEKRQELGPHRPRHVILDELCRGLERLRALYGPRLVAMLVPPWNRIDVALLAELPPLGFAALSAFGPAPADAPITVVNAHVDLIDSRGGNQCREPGRLVEQLAHELVQARAGGGRPVGILSHHLTGDEKALQFLERLFDLTVRHPACRWQGPAELLNA